MLTAHFSAAHRTCSPAHRPALSHSICCWGSARDCLLDRNAQGSATVTVENANGTLLGSASNLQPCAQACTQPFYLLLGQREGLPFRSECAGFCYRDRREC